MEFTVVKNYQTSSFIYLAYCIVELSIICIK